MHYVKYVNNRSTVVCYFISFNHYYKNSIKTRWHATKQPQDAAIYVMLHVMKTIERASTHNTTSRLYIDWSTTTSNVRQATGSYSSSGLRSNVQQRLISAQHRSGGTSKLQQATEIHRCIYNEWHTGAQRCAVRQTKYTASRVQQLDCLLQSTIQVADGTQYSLYIKCRAILSKGRKVTEID